MGDKLKQSYEIDCTMYICEEARKENWCLCYNVYWKDNLNIDMNTWKFKAFYNIKDAKKFAKKVWKQYKSTKLKPYILEKIVPCTFFKKELYLSLTQVNKDKYTYNYARRVW